MKKIKLATWCIFLVLLLSMTISTDIVESSRTRSRTIRIYPDNDCLGPGSSGALPRGEYENSGGCAVILSPHEGFGYVDFFFCPERPWKKSEGEIKKVKITIAYKSGGFWNDGLRVKIARQQDWNFNYGRSSSWDELANFKGSGSQRRSLTLYRSDLKKYTDNRDWMLVIKLEADSLDWFEIFYMDVYYEYVLY